MNLTQMNDEDFLQQDFANMPEEKEESENSLEESVVDNEQELDESSKIEEVPEESTVEENNSETESTSENTDKNEFSDEPSNQNTNNKTTQNTEDKTTSENSINYEEFYKKITQPFKANGKDIKLESAEEITQLMQMGAGFTKRMQELAKFRKYITMLENNNLLDEGKLSYLIDLDKKNPEAIKKLVVDSGTDPLDIDTTSPSNYVGGNHRVSDEEINFRSALDAISAKPNGYETLNTINTTWDQASKDILWKSPEVLDIIHLHHNNGVYDAVTSEMERQKLLGNIRPEMSFLQAYKIVGDELTQRGAFNNLTTSNPAGMAPIATRAAIPKTVSNSKQAAAAASTKGTSAAVKSEILSNLNDEEFLKKFSNLT